GHSPPASAAPPPAARPLPDGASMKFARNETSYPPWRIQQPNHTETCFSVCKHDARERRNVSGHGFGLPHQQALDSGKVASDGGSQGELVERDAVGGDGDAEDARAMGRLDATRRILQHNGVAGHRPGAAQD